VENEPTLIKLADVLSVLGCHRATLWRKIKKQGIQIFEPTKGGTKWITVQDFRKLRADG
jgi:hypothetical protein